MASCFDQSEILVVKVDKVAVRRVLILFLLLNGILDGAVAVMAVFEEHGLAPFGGLPPHGARELTIAITIFLLGITQLALVFFPRFRQAAAVRRKA